MDSKLTASNYFRVIANSPTNCMLRTILQWKLPLSFNLVCDLFLLILFRSGRKWRAWRRRRGLIEKKSHYRDIEMVFFSFSRFCKSKSFNKFLWLFKYITLHCTSLHCTTQHNTTQHQHNTNTTPAQHNTTTTAQQYNNTTLHRSQIFVLVITWFVGLLRINCPRKIWIV